MRASWTDSLWALMVPGKYYTLHDLVNLSGQPGSAVADLVDFLATYGFIDRVGSSELFFTKTALRISLTQCINQLRRIAHP